MKKLILFLTLLFVGFGANFDSLAQYSPSNNLNYLKLLKAPPTGSVEDSVMVFDGSDSFVKMVPKSSIVAGYELNANKQNSLAIDGTGTKYPTVDAVNSSLELKADFNGANASGTWGISISGTATNAANWGGRPADFSANVGKIADIVSFDSSLGFYRKSTSNQVNTFLSPYSGQIWGLLGDSFAVLNIYQPDLENRLGIYTISDGIGGSCITGGTNFEQGDGIDRVPFVDRIDAMLANTTSGILIQGGSNDFYYQVPLGDINSTDRNTFYGAVKEMLLKCVNKVTPNNIRLITPTARDNTKYGGTLGRAYYDNQLRYVNAMKEVAQMYGVICIDLFSGSGFTYENLDVLTSDGVHPNANGKLFFNNFLIANFDTTYANASAPLNSPALTGTPTAPTAAPGTTGNQIATMEALQAHSSSGTYTPTLTNTANITSSTLNAAYYIRNGNLVTVTIAVQTTIATTGAETVLTFSLPVSGATAVNGIGQGNLTSGGGAINGYGIVDITNSTTGQLRIGKPDGSGAGITNIIFTYSL